MTKSKTLSGHRNAVENKQIIKAWSDDLRYVTPDTVGECLNKYWDKDAVLHGFQPIGDLTGTTPLCDELYRPYLRAFPNAKKHLHFLLAGTDNGKEWVVVGGNLVGNFMEPWLGIPPTKLSTWVRFVELYEMQDGKIIRAHLLYDLLSLLNQAGFRFFNALAPEIIIPGPIPNNGVIMGQSDPADATTSLVLEENWREIGLRQLQKLEKMITPNKPALAIVNEYFQKDMMWYGPDSMGSTKGVQNYLSRKELPWQLSMHETEFKKPSVRIAENDYVMTFGETNVVHNGAELFGLPASGKHILASSCHIYRREGDRFAEDFCLMDMTGFFQQLGIDVLKRVREHRFFQRV
jgi:hypothetical protein